MQIASSTSWKSRNGATGTCLAAVVINSYSPDLVTNHFSNRFVAGAKLEIFYYFGTLSNLKNSLSLVLPRVLGKSSMWFTRHVDSQVSHDRAIKCENVTWWCYFFPGSPLGVFFRGTSRLNRCFKYKNKQQLPDTLLLKKKKIKSLR